MLLPLCLIFVEACYLSNNSIVTRSSCAENFFSLASEEKTLFLVERNSNLDDLELINRTAAIIVPARGMYIDFPVFIAHILKHFWQTKPILLPVNCLMLRMFIFRALKCFREIISETIETLWYKSRHSNPVGRHVLDGFFHGLFPVDWMITWMNSGPSNKPVEETFLVNESTNICIVHRSVQPYVCMARDARDFWRTCW